MSTPVVAPNGLNPVNMIGGRHFASAVRQIPIASGYAHNIGRGDIVALTTAGDIRRVNEGVTALTAFAAFAVAPIGIFLGCNFTDPATRLVIHRQNWIANTVVPNAMALVLEDPDVVMQVVVTSATGVVPTSGGATRAHIGENAGYVVPVPNVNAITGNSGISLNQASIAVTATLPWRIVDVVPESRLSDGTFTMLNVIYNSGLHFYRTATGI